MDPLWTSAWETFAEIEPASWVLLLLFLEPINPVFTLVYFLGKELFDHFIDTSPCSVIQCLSTTFYPGWEVSFYV